MIQWPYNGYCIFIAPRLAPCGAAAADAKYHSFEEFSTETFLLPEEGAYSEALEAFRTAELTPNIRLRVHNDYSILLMVEYGLGVSLLPELVLRKTNYQVVILPTEPPIIRTLSIVTKDKHSLSLASKAFIHCLMEARNDLL